jgi:hypothetical protein
MRGMAKPCCKRGCTLLFNIAETRKTRDWYWKEDREGKTTKLRTILKQMTADTAYGKVPYRLSGKSVCARAVERMLGIGHVKFTMEVRFVRHGDVSAVLKKNAWTDDRWRGSKQQRIITWVRGYTGLRCTTGDWMPDKRELHLAYNQITQLYCLYKYDCMEEGIVDTDVGTYQHFNKIFRTHFPHVIVHARKEFSQCSMCAILYADMQGLTDRADLKATRKNLDAHLELVLRQKQKYWDHIKKAINFPSRYMSTILDGMDSMKSICPHWIRTPHAFDGSYSLQLHIEGVLQHGHEPPSSCFLSPPGVGKGACMSIETLTRTLILQKRRQGYVPPVWYIQADNASGEFKNSVCMLYLAMLVQLGLFRKVSDLVLLNVFIFSSCF